MSTPAAAPVVDGARAPGSPGAEPAPVLQARGLSIEFPGVKALQEVDFRLLPGEVHALMGENGAGKSTLIKCVTGVYTPTAGEVLLDGRPVSFAVPAAAQQAGVSTVYQEVNLCTNLTVAENILLGREPRRLGMVDGRGMRARAGEVLARMGLAVDPASTLGSHPIAVQQLVAIARAIAVDARVLVLDEPTSSLDADEVAELFRVVRDLRDRGVAILFVSHFIEQVFEISDRITVLRNGRLVGEHHVSQTSRRQLVGEMLGRELAAVEQVGRRAEDAATPDAAEPVLRATGLGRRGGVEPFDLEVRPGVVVGLAGLLGSGRTELVRLLFGADRPDSGELLVDGRRLGAGPRAAIDAGIAFCSEDRKAEGVVGDLSVRDNLVLALQASRGWMRPLPQRTKDALVDEYIGRLDLRPASPDTLVRNQSGGNQQKVLLARWLVTKPRLLILDEPTRGIDIGAKTQIAQLVTELAAAGTAVVFISAELEEVLRLANRVVVMKDRRKIAELPGGATVDEVMGLVARSEDEAAAPQPPTTPQAADGHDVRRVP